MKNCAGKNNYCFEIDESSVDTSFINRLLGDLGYEDSDILPKKSFQEIRIGKGGQSDLFKPDYVLTCKKKPRIIIDARSPEEAIEKRTLQCSSYCLELNKKYDDNPVLYYIISNGMKTTVYQWDQDDPLLSLDFKDFDLDSEQFQKFKALIGKAAVEESIKKAMPVGKTFKLNKIPLLELIAKFQRIHQYIWKREQKKPSGVFEELIKIAFVKLRKDRDLHNQYAGDPLEPNVDDVVFSVQWIDSQTQSKNPINDILFANLARELEDEIRNHHKKRIFEENSEINLAPDTIKWVVRELEHIDLFGMEEDVHGRMFESFLEATARGKELGQFFTVRDVVKLMVALADIKVTKTTVPTIFDPCCGSGGFLIEAMGNMLRKCRSLKGLSNLDRDHLEDKIRNKSIFGIDAGSDPKIYQIARMNMYLHGDGGSNIYFANSLDKRLGRIGKPSLEIDAELKEIQRLILQDKRKFDVILSNPPFSAKFNTDDPEQSTIMDQYELCTENGKKRKSLLSSVMLLERYKELVSEDGRILAIIDESILSGESYKSIRQYIRDKFIIEGIISLPGDAFRRAAARVKTSILILRLKKRGEHQPEVFMTSAVRLGLEAKIAKRIGLSKDDLDEKKAKETARIVDEFKKFIAGEATTCSVSANRIKDRLDVKYCIGDTGRKKSIWKKQGYPIKKIKSVLTPATNRATEVQEDEEYQFLRVNYSGEVSDGEVKLGSDCSYNTLYRVESWDILMSNMGVGRGAIGIVPPYHANKFVSSEYTILGANSKEEAVYYSNLLKTKEILGDVLSSTTGMNRGRITWNDIAEVEVPGYSEASREVAEELVIVLERVWDNHISYMKQKSDYLSKIAEKLELEGLDAQERWLTFKPPE